MTDTIRLLYWTTLLFTMWLILTANIQLANILTGFGVSFAISLLYLKMFQHSPFKMINPYWLFIYIIILIKNIIISNIEIAIRIFSKDMHLKPAIISIKTELTSDWKKLLLANSITLTPGTLTLDIVDDTLYIHTIECKNIEQKELITKEFEQIIAKI